MVALLVVVVIKDAESVFEFNINGPADALCFTSFSARVVDPESTLVAVIGRFAVGPLEIGESGSDLLCIVVVKVGVFDRSEFLRAAFGRESRFRIEVIGLRQFVYVVLRVSAGELLILLRYSIVVDVVHLCAPRHLEAASGDQRGAVILVVDGEGIAIKVKVSGRVSVFGRISHCGGDVLGANELVGHDNIGEGQGSCKCVECACLEVERGLCGLK